MLWPIGSKFKEFGSLEYCFLGDSKKFVFRIFVGTNFFLPFDRKQNFKYTNLT